MANRINIWNRNHNSIKKCKICDKEFKVKWSGLARRKTCSNECRHKLQKQLIKGNQYGGKGIIGKCTNCKKEFKFSPSQNKKYCSQKCYKRGGELNPQWKGGKPKCKDCNKQLNNRKAKRCKKCSSSLQNNPNWQGGKSFERYSFDFNEELKELIRKRDKYICQICKNHQSQLKRKLHIHHKDRNKKNSNPCNLISLCNSCHNKLHRLEDKKRGVYT